MWKATLLALALLLLSTTFPSAAGSLSTTLSLSPYIAPTQEDEAWNAQHAILIGEESTSPNPNNNNNKNNNGLRRRQQNSCPANYNPCSSLNAGFNAGSVCCASGTECQFDQAGHIACCPRGARCTGTISVGTATASPTGAGNTGGFIVGGGGGATSNTLGLTFPTTSNNFLAPAPTTSGLISQQGLTPGATGGGYFGFIPIATPFPNNQLCSSAYSSCQTEFQKCTAALGGGGGGAIGGGVNGVSISVGGVVTINGPVTLGVASAVTVCQSLSAQACLGLQLSNCNSLGVNRATNIAAMPTPWPPVYGVGVGLIVGRVAEHILG